ncbi:MAG: cysteine desulfurase / selenocysteine lyase [Acidobacteriaceae bacterium]|nr:cysteine desulfurase / selenocysteine lyase [Acidobacteriaceae bacterium]
MSTSEVDRLLLGPQQSPRSAGTAIEAATMPAGLPDPVTLARLANEFFTALPGTTDTFVLEPSAASPNDVNPFASLPATVPAAPSEISLPSDPHFPSLPASAGPPSVSPVSSPIQSTPPPIPGALQDASQAAGPVSGFPSFGFLQDARPIFGDRNTAPTDPYTSARPIVEFGSDDSPSRDLPAFDVETLPHAAEIVQPPSPTMPSTFGFVDSSALPSFSFLEEARPLFSYPPSVPGPLPPLPETDLLSSTPELELRGLQAPGTSAEPAKPTDAPSFDFLNDVRPISSPSTERTLEPAGLDTDVPRELNLSSYSFDAQALKRDFPILRERVNGRPLVWLDNAATTQKPQSVIDRLKYFYEHENSNVHRAAHELAARATDAYASAREKVRRFLNASSTREIIFVRGATEGINLVAQSWGRRNIQKDDEIVVTWLEHHANIVPWQMLCAEKGARLRVAPVDDSGQVLLDEYEKLLGPKTRLVALPQVSNALGIVPPANEMIEAAHRHGAKVLLDGAQSVSHMRVDVQSLDCDFFVFSGHKVFAPTGIGVVYGKSEVLEHMPPWQGGGSMIQDVTFEKTLYQLPPQRFEAGTGNIADAVGLGAAIDYLDRAGMANISRHEHGLLTYATESLLRIPGLHIIGTAREKAGVLSFVLDGFRTEEIGDYLNRNGIAVRSGHHCAQPILRRFGLESTVRASLALYNTLEDIDTLNAALWNLKLGRKSI